MNSAQAMTLFGGTFNPPHWGHLRPLKQAMAALNISRVGLMPCHIPPHKKLVNISTQHRLAMLGILCKQEPSLYIEDIELTSTDVSYTYHTMKKLKAIHQCPLNFVMGTDSFQSFTSWYHWQEILQLCNIIVLNRDNRPLNKLQEVAQYISCGPNDAVSLADKEALTINNGIVVSCHFPTVEVSSTLIREKLEQGDYQYLEAGELLPLEVLEYIKQHQLYERIKP